MGFGLRQLMSLLLEFALDMHQPTENRTEINKFSWHRQTGFADILHTAIIKIAS